MSPAQTRSKRAARLAVLVAIAGLFGHLWLPPRPHAAENKRANPDRSSGGFRNAAIESAKLAVKQRIEAIERQLKRKDITAEERKALHKQLARLDRAIDNNAKFFSDLWDLLANAKKAIKTLDEEYDSGYQQGLSYNVGWHVVKDLKHLGIVDILNSADFGLDWYLKLKSLKGKLDKIDALELSPGGTSLARHLTYLTDAMSIFGGKVPLIGSFVQAYGAIGGQLLSSAAELDKKFKLQEGGLVIPGVKGDRSVMMDRLRDHDFSSAIWVQGLREVFWGEGDGPMRLIIWDRKARDWVVVDEVAKGVSLDELRRRYLGFARAGNKRPTPQEILDYENAIELELVPSRESIGPGETVTLTVVGKMMRDEQAAPAHRVAITLTRHAGAGVGKFDGPTEVKIGEAVRWTAPAEANKRFVFSADLSAESKQVVRTPAPATAVVVTAGATTLQLSASSSEIVAGQAVALTAVVADESGKPLASDLSGPILFSEASGAGSWPRFSTSSDHKGATRVWRSPRTPGTYTITARYLGGSDFRVNPLRAQPCEAQITLTVEPIDFAISVDQGEKPATSTTAATFTIAVTNNQRATVSFDIRTKVLLRQRRYWQVTGNNGQLEIAGGSTQQFAITAKPTDAERALRHHVRVIARPFGALPGKYVTVTVDNAERCAEAERDQCIAEVVATYNKSRATCDSFYGGQLCPWSQCQHSGAARRDSAWELCLARHRCPRDDSGASVEQVRCRGERNLALAACFGGAGASCEQCQSQVANTCTTPAQPDKPDQERGKELSKDGNPPPLDPPTEPHDKSCKPTATGCDKAYRACCEEQVKERWQPPGQEDCNHTCWAKHKAADKSHDKSRSWNGCLAYCDNIFTPLYADCLEQSRCYRPPGTSPATMRCRARLNGQRASCHFSANCEIDQKWRDAYSACSKLR